MEWTLHNIVVVAIISIVAIVLIVSLFGPKIGLLNVAAKLGIKMGEAWLPAKAPEKLKPATEAEIPEELSKGYDKLITAFEKGIKAEAPALIKYELPENFKDYKIIINREEKLYLHIAKNEQIFKNKEFDIKTCITSGRKNGEIVAQNLYEKLFKKVNSLNTFNEVDDITIENNNQLNVGNRYDITGFFLYKPDNEHICFLTTDDDFGSSCDGGREKGLDDDCLNDFKFKQFFGLI